MIDRIWVKPVEGAAVLDPLTKLVMPRDGMFIAAGDPHWMAHMRFGDIVVTEAPKAHVDELAGMEQVENDRLKRLSEEAAAQAAEAEEVKAAKAASAEAQPGSEPEAPVASFEH